jgi:hypothetical protein
MRALAVPCPATHRGVWILGMWHRGLEVGCITNVCNCQARRLRKPSHLLPVALVRDSRHPSPAEPDACS